MLDGTVLSAKSFVFFLRKNGEKNIALAEGHFSNQLTK